MSDVSVNKEAIKKNKKRIFEIDSEVMTNKTMIYASRSMIEENRLMILSNYAAAFMGNRQIANSNTDEIFENRQAILDNAETNNGVEENFINSQKNKAALDFLNHRSALNSAVLSISEEMADINSRLIDINRRIMESNQEIVEFNQNQIEMNSSLLGGDLQPSNATPESNATTIENNQKMMAELEERVSANRAKMESLIDSSNKNSEALMENKKGISDRRQLMMSNREKIMGNKSKIFS